MMEQRMETLTGKKLVGGRMTMSFSNNKTAVLWRGFMPDRKKITNSVGMELYSMQIYPASFYDNFNPNTIFEKWAAVEVTDFSAVPDTMETFVLAGGLYAVFLYKGAVSGGDAAFRYIFTTWLPASPYTLDDRPHFEILGEKYKNDDPGSEEEIWIPVKFK